MKTAQWALICSCIVFQFCVLADALEAATFSGRSSTVLEWFDDPSDETAMPVYEYLLLNVLNIDNEGMTFKGYGRLATDIKDVVDADSRLYYAYLEKNGLFNRRLDLRFGRQFVVTTAGASVMDGLDLKLNRVGPVSLRFFGGGDATYYEDYDKDDLIWGAEINGLFLENSLNLGISYLQKWDESELTKELIGFDLDYDRKNLVNVYSELQLNYLNNVVSYFLAGAKYYKSPKWNLRGEYLYSLPVFSSTSIYSVFAVDKYQEFMTEYTYNINLGLRAFGRFSHEFYEDFSDADVFEVGIEKIRTEQFSGYLTGVFRNDDDGQDLKGVKIRAAWMFNKKIHAGAGINLDVLDRRLDFDNNEDETTSSLLWLYGTYYFTDKVNMQLKVEQAHSDLWDEYYRGRVRLNISF